MWPCVCVFMCKKRSSLGEYARYPTQTLRTAPVYCIFCSREGVTAFFPPNFSAVGTGAGAGAAGCRGGGGIGIIAAVAVTASKDCKRLLLYIISSAPAAVGCTSSTKAGFLVHEYGFIQPRACRNEGYERVVVMIAAGLGLGTYRSGRA